MKSAMSACSTFLTSHQPLSFARRPSLYPPSPLWWYPGPLSPSPRSPWYRYLVPPALSLQLVDRLDLGMFQVGSCGCG